MADLKSIFESAGIMTPSEKIKQQQALQQQQYQNQMAQIASQQQQQQLAQKSGELSEGFGFPTYLIEQGFNKMKARGGGQPAIPQGDSGMQMDQNKATNVLSGVMGNDLPSQGGISGNLPRKQSSVFRDLASSFKQSGDVYRAMAFEVEARKAELDEAEEDRKVATEARNVADQKIQQEEEARRAAQAGNSTETRTFRKPNGDIVTQAPVKDKNGGILRWETIGSGPNRQETQNIDDPRTKAQTGAAFEDFRKQVLSARNFLDGVTGINEKIDQGAKTGWVGSGVTVLDDALSGAKQVADYMLNSGQVDQDAVDYLQTSSGWKVLSTKTSLSKSQYDELAYALAAAQNTSGQITTKDLKAAESQLGSSLADSQKAKLVLNEVANRMRGKIRNSYETMGTQELQDSARPIYNNFENYYKEFDSKRRTPVSGTASPEVLKRIAELEKQLGIK